MSYSLAEKLIPKFLWHLQDKGIIQEYKSDKTKLKEIFEDEFRPIHQVKKFSFSKMYHYMKYFKIISFDPATNIITFKPDVLNNITADSNIEKRKTFKIAPVLQKQQHYHTVDPKLVASSSGKSDQSGPAPENGKVYECTFCNRTFTKKYAIEKHNISYGHIIKERFVKVCKKFSKPDPFLFAEIAAGHGGGVEILGKITGVPSTVKLFLNNKTAKTYNVTDICEMKANKQSININGLKTPFELATNAKVSIELKVCFKSSGSCKYPLIFKLEGSKTGSKFEIFKELIFDVHSEDISELSATEPYQKKVIPQIFDTSEGIVPGKHPNKSTADFIPKFPLPKYELPCNLVMLLNYKLKESSAMNNLQYGMLRNIKQLLSNYDKNALNTSNYFDLLELLLYMEEHQMKIDIRIYDMENQTLKCIPHSNLLELNVPGLAEHRPSVLRGDSVFAKESIDSKIKYEGIVHRVNMDSVVLGFSRRFISDVFVNNKKFHVSFSFNRVTLRAEHQALELARKHNIIHLLCQSKVTASKLQNFGNITWYNSNIANNKKQEQAIRQILSRSSRSVPYLIFGPPGTGKTVTVVEAILQILQHKPNENILVCAPSNSAANEITKRLVNHVPQRHLFRYIAPSFSYDSVDVAIRPYTNYKDDYYHPPILSLITYRVIITTLVTASRLVNAGIPAKHFSYVFIDESGQATETETLIPIAGILSSMEKHGCITGQIVLAGDPKQLGPIIHSKMAENYGFGEVKASILGIALLCSVSGTSMLERLMNSNPIYSKNSSGQYNEAVLTKLVKSYRSHRCILEVPNKLFYDGELQPAGEASLTNIAVGWDELPNPDFPMIFHGVEGVDQQEKNSPSFFNLQELEVVRNYLDKLIGGRLKGMEIKPSHIGIITPYRKQVEKLKQACAKRNWKDLSIGSVEQFQGQERLIIIVSTVRSKPQFVQYDVKHHLGFLTNWKRFNVAITRAKALLIVVGNPNVLQMDKHWLEFIKYCKKNRCYKGIPFVPSSGENQTELNFITDWLKTMNINDDTIVPEEGSDFSRGNK